MFVCPNSWCECFASQFNLLSQHPALLRLMPRILTLSANFRWPNLGYVHLKAMIISCTHGRSGLSEQEKTYPTGRLSSEDGKRCALGVVDRRDRTLLPKSGRRGRPPIAVLEWLVHRSATGKTGSMKPASWKTKNRGKVSSDYKDW